MVKYPESGHTDGISISKLSQHKAFSQDCVFAGVLHEDTETITMPRGDDLVFPGDRLFLVINSRRVSGISHFLRR